MNHIYREENVETNAISTCQDFEDYIWWNVITGYILTLVENDS